MGAAGKPVGDKWLRLSACIHAVEIDPPEGSPKVDFRMVLILRSEELGRTAYMGAYSPPMGLYRGQPWFKVLVSHMVGRRVAEIGIIF